MKQTLKITDMECAACSARLENVVGKIQGVKSCSVNLATECMAVEFDPSTTTIDNIHRGIKNAGFGWSEIKDYSTEGDGRSRELKKMWQKFMVAAIFSVPLVYLAMGHMLPFGISLPLPKTIHPIQSPFSFAFLQFLLTVPVVIAGYRFYHSGLRAIWRRAPNMDSLIASGTIAAILYSLYSTTQIAKGHTQCAEHLYFETAAMIVTLVLLGRTLEAMSISKAGTAINKLIALRPTTAIILRHGHEVEVPVDEIAVGDVVLIKPGGKLPVDGVVIEGNTTIDEAMLTGESMPVEKIVGDTVFAATINKSGLIKLQATKVGSDTALAQIIKLVEIAQGSKAPISRMADKVAGIFVPVVFCIAVLAFTGWLLATKDIGFALTIFISVLVIACPCALGLATPLAITVGVGKGAENGILIKNGAILEATHKVKTVIFDKTGTLTEGSPRITDVITANGIDKLKLLLLVASAEHGSEHPIGKAICRHADNEQLDLLPITEFEAIAGQGIKCNVGECHVVAGNKTLIEALGISVDCLRDEADRLADEGKTPMFVAINKKIAGLIAVATVLKKNSVYAVKKLASMGIETVMLTGDNRRTATAIARQAGIKRVFSEVLPQAKAEKIKAIQDGGRAVAMVGDGINDAPALVQADIGIAVGSGTDIAVESADIVLMKNDLADIVAAIELSKATMTNIKQNLFWAFGYNIAGIPVAAGILHIFGGPLLSPIIAAAAMSLSCLSIIANALRLKTSHFQNRHSFESH
ncbi:MAG: heavy metal translocating P-type ATPase [Holophagaceae bacterium]|nr:heavy metal translocating P-type ATPase [Holophagaceae bacterium]